VGHEYLVVENWRTSHSFPLNTFQVGLRARAKRLEPDALVAQRLKRFASVMNKLAREPRMKLSQMQDLGGCRAIFRDLSSVDRLLEQYRGGDRLVFDPADEIKCYDYIRKPKSDGYRGVHVVGRYSARVGHREAWNGYRIEIQVRSRLQHAFATAVETVTTFTRQPLKFGSGQEEWRRFFALAGSAFALHEGTTLVTGTPRDRGELVRELREASRQLKVKPRLRPWAQALETLPRRNIKGFKWLLLVLNVRQNTIKVTGFSDRQRAVDANAELEQRKSSDLDAVLVWVNSAKNLRAAYPNYYADTREFIDALDESMRSAGGNLT